jgi:hypothetical protein
MKKPINLSSLYTLQRRTLINLKKYRANPHTVAIYTPKIYKLKRNPKHMARSDSEHTLTGDSTVVTVDAPGPGHVLLDDLHDHDRRLAVPAHVLAASIFTRFESRQDDSPAMKAVAALRQQFGGHAVKR